MMAISLDGFSEFKEKILDKKIKFKSAMQLSANDICKEIASNASGMSPIKTGTLKKSFETNKEADKISEGYIEKEVWSNPSIIATNPDHPNGDYYSDYIENGFTDRGGVWHEGVHMFESALTIAEKDKITIIKNNMDRIMGDK